jgi:putative oxidoreductase
VKQTALAMRLILGGVFLYSGLVKASSSAQFAIALVPFTFLPTTWLRPVAVLLPLCEMVAGVLVLTPRTSRVGAGLIFVMCAAFATVLGWALANGIIVSCSCFGGDETPSATKMVIAMGRDLFLASLALTALYLERKLSNGSRVR